MTSSFTPFTPEMAMAILDEVSTIVSVVLTGVSVGLILVIIIGKICKWRRE